MRLLLVDISRQHDASSSNTNNDNDESSSLLLLKGNVGNTIDFSGAEAFITFAETLASFYRSDTILTTSNPFDLERLYKDLNLNALQQFALGCLLLQSPKESTVDQGE